MYQILITTSAGSSAVHTTAVSFNTQEQAIAAADLVNASATINQNGELYRQASLLFVPVARQEGASVGDRGLNIPGVDRETVNRVIDRLGQAVKSVEESRALDQVRSGFDRFVASAEQLIKRQSAGTAGTSDSQSPSGFKEEPGSSPEPAGFTDQGQRGRIRFLRAVEVTEAQQLAVSRSPLAAEGDIVLVWVKKRDLEGQEEVFPFS